MTQEEPVVEPQPEREPRRYAPRYSREHYLARLRGAVSLVPDQRRMLDVSVLTYAETIIEDELRSNGSARAELRGLFTAFREVRGELS